MLVLAPGEFFASPVVSPGGGQPTGPYRGGRIAKGATVEAVIVIAGAGRDAACGADGAVMMMQMDLRRDNVSVDLTSEFGGELKQGALLRGVNSHGEEDCSLKRALSLAISSAEGEKGGRTKRERLLYNYGAPHAGKASREDDDLETPMSWGGCDAKSIGHKSPSCMQT